MFLDFIARKYSSWDKNLYMPFKIPQQAPPFSLGWSPPETSCPPLWDLDETHLQGTWPSFLGAAKGQMTSLGCVNLHQLETRNGRSKQ